MSTRLLCAALTLSCACVAPLGPASDRTRDAREPSDAADPKLPPDEDPPPLGGDACAEHQQRLEALADRLERERVELDIPGAAIALVVDDCLFARGLGVQAPGGAPVDEHTRFQLASMTKTLTALTALSLEEDGVIDRAAPVADLVSTTSNATLEELLAHRAGYPTDLPTATSLDLATYLDDNASAPMWAPPGEVWLYSNPGFALAGRALEVAAGAPFEQLVQERVFAPAGMSDAIMGATLDGAEPNMARGHSGDPARPELIEPTDLYLASTYYGPMGGAFASAADLTRLMHAFFGDAVVSSTSLDDMARSRGPAWGSAIGYGQGLFSMYEGTVFHGGSVAGFLSEMDLHPEARVGVAILSAADWAFPSETLNEAFAELWPAGPPPPAAEGPSDAEVVGSYHDDVVLGDVVVSRAGGALSMSFDGTSYPLTRWAPGTFSFSYPPWQMDVEVSFQRGPSGTLHLVTLLGVAARAV